MSTLAERVRKALDLSGKNQKELAAACGITAPSVNDWLSGKTKSLKATTAHRAASFLGVNMQWLTEDRGPMLSRAESHPPTPTLLEEKPTVGEEPHTGGYSSPRETPIPAQNWPPFTAEQVMEGGVDDRTLPFTWIAEDHHLADARERPVWKTWHVAIQPNAQWEPDDVVLVMMSGGRPVLRRITYAGDTWRFVVDSKEIEPVKYDPENHKIVGVMLTAYPGPVKRRPLNAPDEAKEVRHGTALRGGSTFPEGTTRRTTKPGRREFK